MTLFALRLILTMLAVALTAHHIPGIEVKSTSDLFFFGLVVGILNAIVRPVLTILTLPITIFTLGLFTFVVNAFVFWLASEISYGVHITTFWGAFWGGVVVWLIGLITNKLIWYKEI